MSNTAQRIPSSHSGGWDRNHEAALSAVLPPTMSISWRPPTSTTEVHHCLVRHRPFRQNNASCRCPQLRPRLSDRCRPPGGLRPSGRPRCSPYANHNPAPRRPRRPNGPAHPPRWSPTSPLGMSTTPAPPQYQVEFPRWPDTSTKSAFDVREWTQCVGKESCWEGNEQEESSRMSSNVTRWRSSAAQANRSARSPTSWGSMTRRWATGYVRMRSTEVSGKGSPLMSGNGYANWSGRTPGCGWSVNSKRRAVALWVRESNE